MYIIAKSSAFGNPRNARHDALAALLLLVRGHAAGIGIRGEVARQAHPAGDDHRPRRHPMRDSGADALPRSRIQPFMSERPVNSNIGFHLPQLVAQPGRQLVILALDGLSQLFPQFRPRRLRPLLGDQGKGQLAACAGAARPSGKRLTSRPSRRQEAFGAAQLALLAELGGLHAAARAGILHLGRSRHVLAFQEP